MFVLFSLVGILHFIAERKGARSKEQGQSKVCWPEIASADDEMTLLVSSAHQEISELWYCMTTCCLDFGVELWTDFQAQRYLGGVYAISDCQGKKLPKKASGTVVSRAEL
jgi:hypothetical protein